MAATVVILTLIATTMTTTNPGSRQGGDKGLAAHLRAWPGSIRIAASPLRLRPEQVRSDQGRVAETMSSRRFSTKLIGVRPPAEHRDRDSAMRRGF